MRSEATRVSGGIGDFLSAASDYFPELTENKTPEPDVVQAAKLTLSRMTRLFVIRGEMQSSHSGRSVLSKIEEEIELDLDKTPSLLWGGLLIPALGAIQTEAELFGIRSISYLTDQIATGRYPQTLAFLEETRAIEQGKLSHTGKLLLRNTALGGYTQLAYSYFPYFLNLGDLLLDPSLAGQGKQIDRMQPENAQASNKLISNIVGRLARESLNENVRTVLDFGSGGGYFLLAMAKEGRRVVGLDISTKAVSSSLGLFESFGADGKIYLGSLLNAEDLARIAQQERPDIAFINYILHDIAGSGKDRAGGLKIVGEFLNLYRSNFPAIPLYISETYFSSTETLKADGKVTPILFALLHTISPQRLLRREDFFELLDRSGYVVSDELVHTRHKDGSPANSTVMAIPR
ncbi:MAG: methyltransferase domain-containing protein [Anaerolineales bacterium]